MPEETFGEKVQEGLEQVKSGVKDLAAKAGIGSDEDVGPAGGAQWGSRTRTASSASRSHGRSAATRAKRAATRTKSTAESTATRTKSTAKSTATHAKSGATRTKDELYADATRLGIKGRSKMTKAELEKAVRRG